jgi:hypothetical protein
MKDLYIKTKDAQLFVWLVDGMVRIEVTSSNAIRLNKEQATELAEWMKQNEAL